MKLSRPPLRRPKPGPRLSLALLAALLVLLPGLLGAELVVRGYERRAVEDGRQRVVAGLDGVAGLVEQERTRTLNNAEVVAVRLGRDAQDGADDNLLKATVAARQALRVTLVAVLDGAGRTLASDVASNQPFATQSEVRAALQGRSAVGLQDRAPGLAVQAAAPLRGDQGPLPGAAVVAQNLDDTWINGAARLTGLEFALAQNGRVVAASRGARRALSSATDLSVDPELLGQPGDTFKVIRLGAESLQAASRSVVATDRRELATLVALQSADALAAGVRQARILTWSAASLSALLAGLAGALVGSRWSARLGRAARTIRALETSGPDRAALWPGRGPWAELGLALNEVAGRLAERRTELVERAEWLEAVVGSLAEGVIVADSTQQVTLVNPAARTLLSLPPGSGAAEALARIADQDGPNSLAVSERVIRSYSAAVLDQRGKQIGTLTVLRDATREQELERLKSEFLAVVSHELQTPLTAIKGALELVVEDDGGQLSRVQRRFLDTIERNCDRLVGLVGDLLDLSRLEAGRVELSLQPLDPASLVQSSVASLGNLFEARHQRVALDLPDGLPPLLGDRRRVEQVLTNLLTNAARYAPPGGRVHVSAWSEAATVGLTVADSGPGVPESERDQIFDRFYRGSTSRRDVGGSGLGLAIARSLVELHGGTIRVEGGSPDLPGARFTVELPRAPEDE